MINMFGQAAQERQLKAAGMGGDRNHSSPTRPGRYDGEEQLDLQRPHHGN